MAQALLEEGLAGLEGRSRRGRPPVFPPQVAIEIKALACELPAKLGVHLSRLFVPDIRDEAISRGIVAGVSGSTIWRWLAEDAIRPWTYRSWVFPRDPDFENKAGRVLDPYGRSFEGNAFQRLRHLGRREDLDSGQGPGPPRRPARAGQGRPPRL